MPQPLNSANLRRAAVLWQIGQNLARARQQTHDPKRDMCITVGSGSGDHYTPDVRMTMGSALLAHAVVNGELEVAFVNPTALLTQACRGVGLFQQPLPVHALAVYPSLDHFIFALHPRLGIRSFAELGERHPAMRLSIRLDETHATRVLLDQTLAAYNLSLRDLEAWGCSFHYVSSPSDARRLSALREDQLDAVFDEGIRGWF